MKRILALALVIVVLISISGCNSAHKQTTADTNTNPSETTTTATNATEMPTTPTMELPSKKPTSGTKPTETIAPPTMPEFESTEPEFIQQGSIRLNRMDITFTYAGESWDLYSGDVEKASVTFTSEDSAVVTFVDGRVMAVGNGQTTVYATYADQKVSCVIRCNFQEGTGVAGNGGVSEDG